MLGTRSFQNVSDDALVIDKTHLDFGIFAVRHAECHCPIDELLQVIDSHCDCLGPRIMPENVMRRCECRPRAATLKPHSSGATAALVTVVINLSRLPVNSNLLRPPAPSLRECFVQESHQICCHEGILTERAAG